MTVATVSVTHSDGTTEVCNTSQVQADSIGNQLLVDLGAPDLDTTAGLGGSPPPDAAGDVADHVAAGATETRPPAGTSYWWRGKT